MFKSFLLNCIEQFTLLPQLQPTWDQICDVEPVVWRVECICTCACIMHFIQLIFFFCCMVFTCPCLSLSLFLFLPKFYSVKENQYVSFIYLLKYLFIFIFNLYVPLQLKWVSYKQHKIESCCLIHSCSLCLRPPPPPRPPPPLVCLDS